MGEIVRPGLDDKHGKPFCAGVLPAVSLDPDAAALDSDRGVLTYRALDESIERIAAGIARSGAGPGDVVAVVTRHREDAILGLLGVLRSGAVYLPLNVSAPLDQLRFQVQDSGAALVLVGEGTDPAPLRLPFASIVDFTASDHGEAAPDSDQDGTAYLIYTSGTTGRPKAVGVTRSAFHCHIGTMVDRFGITSADRVLQFAHPHVDVALEQTFTALAAGATLVLIDGRPPSLPDLVGLLADKSVTVANFPAAYWSELALSLDRLADLPDSLRLVVSGSDRLPPRAAAAWRARTSVRLLNAYGPTETVITATVAEVTPADTDSVPIGPPIGDRTAHVLDDRLRPVANGVVGELYLGGPEQAYGYPGHPGLTAERFVADPFAHAPGRRIYRTGDLVRRRADGALEFLGRRDNQVKIRGHRVEPEEVEIALTGHPDVVACAVKAVEVADDRRLVAYVTTTGNPDGARIMAWAGGVLPEHMVPAAVVLLDEMPMTSTGKVDRLTLPEPTWQGASDESFAPARTELERVVAAVWADVLGLDRVGIHDNFFHLGGDSLTAVRVTVRLLEVAGTSVSPYAVFDAPTLATYAAAIARGGDAGPSADRVATRHGDHAPLSWWQHGLWLLDRWQPGTPVYNVPWVFEFAGPVDAGALHRALAAVVDRHQVLRTVFRLEDGGPRQAVVDGAPVPFTVDDLDASGAADRLAELVDREASDPFDLEAGPLVRARLIRTSELTSTFVAVFHHIVWDEWSLRVFERELAELYRSELDGRQAELPELPVQYADYASWQHESGAERLEEQLRYWEDRLAGAPSSVNLPTDRPRPLVQTHAGGSLRFEFPARLAAEVRSFSRAQGVTPFMTFLAALAAVLQRFTGDDDFVVGTPVAVRDRPEVENLIGYFVNMLPLRLAVADDVGFGDLVRQVRTSALEAYRHQDAPFDAVVDRVSLDRMPDRNPLFQIVLEMHPEDDRQMSLPGVAVRRRLHTNAIAKFDLAWSVYDQADGFRGWVEFDSDLFDADTVRRYVEEWLDLLDVAIQRPDVPLWHLPSGRVSTPATPAPAARPDRCVHELFEERVAAAPDLPALREVDGTRVSYGELNARANRLARALIARGIRRGDLVGLRANRSVECVVAMLAILKAGAGYVPLEGGVPEQRLRDIADECRLRVIVTASPLTWDPAHTPVLDLGGDAAEIARQAPDNPAVEVGPDDVVYVPYTSGSTGRPKGTVVPHRGVPGFFTGADYASWGPGTVSLMHSALSWDGHVLDLYPALLSGGEVAVFDGPAGDPLAVAHAAEQAGVTVLWLTATAFGLVVRADPFPLAGVRHLLVGGEDLPVEQVRRALNALPDTALVNGYGPSECTVFSTVRTLTADDAARTLLPIGAEVGDRRVHVFDRRLNPVPVGMVGELFVSGPAVSHGYLGRSAMTAAAFVPDPTAPGARMYRTGDLVRRRRDGLLEFIGRSDGQVKVRGHRVELAEVEAVFAEHPSVRACAVTALVVGAEKRLACYLSLREGTGPAAVLEELRTWAEARLPRYMIPGGVAVLDEFPLTRSGKIDRRSMPEPVWSWSADREFVAPRSEVECVAAAVWLEVLGVERVGVHDDFFHLGGHSLAAVRVAMELVRRTDLDVRPADVVRERTVARLSAAMATGKAAS